MANWFWRITDEIDPETTTYDLSTAGLLGPAEIPQVVGVSYWVSTPGGAGAGGFAMNFNWEDKQGTMRQEPGTPFSLQDPTAFTRIPVIQITRSSESAPLNVEAVLSGAADGAKIRYAFLISPSYFEGNSVI